MKTIQPKNTFLFDWGNTLMRDYPEVKTPMYTWDKVEVIPHAAQILKTLSTRANVYLATNAIVSTKEEIIMALRRGGLDMYLKDVFCYRELGVKKPSVEYFDSIFDTIKRPKESAIMVGDNLTVDVRGAIDYGIDAVLYDPRSEHIDYSGYRITDLLELEQIAVM